MITILIKSINGLIKLKVRANWHKFYVICEIFTFMNMSILDYLGFIMKLLLLCCRVARKPKFWKTVCP